MSFLAAGGMGEVYRAHDERLGRTVALKVLPQSMFGDAEAVGRFEREARAAAAVAHPNLVAVHDVGREGDTHDLVMDLLEGETLRQRLAGGALEWRDAVNIAIAVSEAIAAVHAKGFVHRDLKPENIFITTDGWVKLPVAEPSADEPTVRALTQRGAAIGTTRYMAPEQLRGEDVDGRADIFATGCVLAEMVAGEPLFRQTTHADTIAAILSGSIMLPRFVPPAVDAVIRRCVQTLREQRFQSAAELTAALRDVSEGRVFARVATTSEPSIAVLPFVNLGGDAENEYFCDGLAEEILTSLATLPGLKVTARTSAFAFRGKQQDIRTIAQALGVRTILEGGVRRAGNRVRVTAQLVDAASGFHLWSARYDAMMDDVFAVQDEIVDTLHLHLASPKRSAVPHTSNLDAWHAYLRSRHHFSQLTPEGLGRSRAWAEQAIELDPDFAAAQAQLAECFIQTAIYGLRSGTEMLPLARAAALKAVALDASEASAQMTLGRIAVEADGDWSEALRRCRLALASNRVPPAVRGLAAQYVLWPLGRYDEVTSAVRPAFAADPLSPMPRFVLGQTLYASGDRDRGIDEIRAVIELHEHSGPAISPSASCIRSRKRPPTPSPRGREVCALRRGTHRRSAGSPAISSARAIAMAAKRCCANSTRPRSRCCGHWRCRRFTSAPESSTARRSDDRDDRRALSGGDVLRDVAVPVGQIPRVGRGAAVAGAHQHQYVDAGLKFCGTTRGVLARIELRGADGTCDPARRESVGHQAHH